MDDREAHEFYADPANRAVSGPGRKRQGQLSGMTSVRFAPEVIEAVKERASGEGVTVGSWIRRLVDREIAGPRFFDLAVEGEDEPVRVPTDALERLTAALMPALMRHGSLDLRVGPAAWRGDGTHATSSIPVSIERPQYGKGYAARVKWIDEHRDEAKVVPDSGRPVASRRIPSSLSLPRSFSCPHISVGNVASVTCETCGPLDAAA